MLRFLLKILLAGLPAWMVWGYMAVCPLSYIDDEAPHYIWNKEFSHTDHGEDVSVIALGDSVGNSAFAPEYISESFVNLALGGTTPVENYSVLCDYLEHNAAPKACYIVFFDPHLVATDCFYSRSLYSHRFDVQKERAMFRSAKQYQEPSIIREGWMRDWLEYRIYYPEKYLPAVMNSLGGERKMANADAVYKDGIHRGTYIGRGAGEYADTSVPVFDSYTVGALFDEYYRKILELCRDNGIRVRIIMTPLYPNVVCTEQYQREMTAYYAKLQEAYPNVAFYDKPIALGRECFCDDHHFNAHGSFLFSQYIREVFAEDFPKDEELSDSSIEGMNDYIAMENRADYLMKRVCAGPYAAVVYCRNGKKALQSIVDDGQKVTPLSGHLFYVNGAGAKVADDEAADGIVVSDEAVDGEMRVDLNLLERKIDFAAEWTEDTSVGLGDDSDVVAFVINRHTSSLQCVKTFRGVEKGYLAGE